MYSRCRSRNVDPGPHVGIGGHRDHDQGERCRGEPQPHRPQFPSGAGRGGLAQVAQPFDGIAHSGRAPFDRTFLRKNGETAQHTNFSSDSPHWEDWKHEVHSPRYNRAHDQRSGRSLEVGREFKF